MHKILAINPGSTSTKIAIYEDTREICKKTIEHPIGEIEKYKNVAEQYEMRHKAIMEFLNEIRFDVKELSAVVGRGGLLPPVKSGAYRVNKAMVDRLKYRPVVEHASNLGAIIAYEIAEPLAIPSFIYDSVAVDELENIARISGMADIERKSFSHALNMRAVAIKVAKNLRKDYKNMNLIVTHLGGGISISVHRKGKMIDIVSDDEGPFSPERAGRVPCKDLINMCYEYDKNTMKKKLRGKGGLVSYLDTNSALEVEDKIKNGDKKAKLIYEAMAYQIAKGIGELATVIYGDVDRIIITGGIAYSKMMTEWIKKRVEFIAPVEIVPGENELESLALGTLRVLKGEEKAREYDLD
ncbi:butyrate kinase [Paramaledivibacter caminithermalis]|jgi:butyrate kinase|uniref:Probable butyrate kinase n=1 Tax=Paramaledivibacter caminithermalis (strain DSM 15212 / CIP 107654 / DViRD3) TaxID=1121301 RepID=A0A1M6RGE5_PARC5|nr:butyrate kinase [Paramaledivibacter caminithermalis]SHK31437.1 butyrate kinase [Paramaledivibacter caminithermalis DSM 15212]